MDFKRFETLVPDEQMRQFILGDMSTEFDNLTDYYVAFNAVLNLAFVYVYSCCKDLHNRLCDPYSDKTAYDKCLEKSNANSLRVLRTVERIYTDFQIGPQLIQYVLSDVYFDFLLGGVESKLFRFLPDCISADRREDFTLSEYFNYVNESLVSSRLDGFTLDEADEKLESLLRAFPFIKNTSLCYETDRDWYVFCRKPNKIFADGKINTFGIIRKFEERKTRFYLLKSLENNALRYERLNQSAFILMPVCDYISGWRFGEVCVSPFEIHQDFESIETFLKKTSNPSKNVGQNIAIKQIFNINYKCLKNLALAISDVIGMTAYAASKDGLKKAFYSDYKVIFDNAEDDWDSIIVMLLIEAGPLRVLQNVFLSNDSIDTQLIENIKSRFSQNSLEKLSAINDGDDLTAEAEHVLNTDGREVRFGHTTKAYSRLLAEIKARIILGALSLKTENESVSYDYNNNLKQTIAVLEQFKKSETSEDGTINFLNYSLKETLKRVICFYAGVFGYGRLKYDYDNDSRERLLSSEEVKIHQEKVTKAFVDEATKEHERLKDVIAQSKTPIWDLFKELDAMCKRCVEDSGHGVYSRTKESRYLNTAIGKYFIFNIGDFAKYFELQSVPDVNKNNLGDWLTKSIQLIKFLRTGDANAELSDEDFRKSIYPLVGTYCRKGESEDGYLTAVFSLEVDRNLNGEIDYIREIKVLSEFDYNLGCKYYCLPNVSRYTQKWWIDPLIIECNQFDEIFKDKKE